MRATAPDSQIGDLVEDRDWLRTGVDVCLQGCYKHRDALTGQWMCCRCGHVGVFRAATVRVAS